MAYFEQRKTGWLAQVRRKGMPSISRTFDLKVDAEAWAREVEREAQRGNVAALRQDAQRTTVADVVARYVAGPVQSLRSARDVSARCKRAADRFGAYFLANVRAADVAAWRDDLLREGYSAQSVVHHINALSAVLAFAQRDLSIDLPQGNPCRVIRKPSTGSARNRRLKPGELDYLLRATDSGRADRMPGLRQIIILAVETSMRLGELLALQWQHVDLKAHTAHLPRTKNGEARTVALSSVAVTALQALPRRLDGRVFGWAAADSFEKTWVRSKARAHAFYEADCSADGVRPDPAFLADLRFHDLRHEATSRLFEKGLGIMEVASMTGHKSLSMLKRYTHVDAAKLAKKLR